MKRTVLLALAGTSLFAYSQPNEHEMTILEKLYSVQTNAMYKIIEEKGHTRRELVYCKSKDENSFKKYVLTEFGYENMVTGSAYLVSKDHFPNGLTLYNITLGKELVINLDKMNQAEDNKYYCKLTVILREELIDATDRFEKIVNKLDEGETAEICLAHWWVSCLVETGEVIETAYLGSDCYSLGYSGEANNANSRNCDHQPQGLCNLVCKHSENTINSTKGIEAGKAVSMNTVPTDLSERIRLAKGFKLARLIPPKVQHPVTGIKLHQNEDTRKEVQE